MDWRYKRMGSSLSLNIPRAPRIDSSLKPRGPSIFFSKSLQILLSPWLKLNGTFAINTVNNRASFSTDLLFAKSKSCSNPRLKIVSLMTRKWSSRVKAKTNGTNCFSRQRKMKPQFWVVVILFSGWNVSNACYDAILQSSSDERGCSCCRVCRWPPAGSSTSALRRSRGSTSPDSSPG